MRIRVGDRSRGRFATPADFSSTRLYPVQGATRTPLGFGNCATFKGQFLSPRAVTIRNFSIAVPHEVLNRCTTRVLKER